MNMKKEKTEADLRSSILENEARILKRFRGDRDFLKEIYSVFLEEIPEKTQALRQGETTLDFGIIEEVAHALRSSSATIGVRACSELAAGIEEAAVHKNSEMMKALASELYSLFGMLAPIIEERKRAL
jgi:HPt (histidine-containing phosphotransfer) domain-containing protein